jgi:hypothetical protein
MEEILQELEKMKDIVQMESYFREILSKTSYTNEQLEGFKSHSIIKKHSGLQYILQKTIESNNYKSSNEYAKKESVLKKIFCGMGQLWP